MILNTIRFQLEDHTSYETLYFQGVGAKGSQYAMNSVVVFQDTNLQMNQLSDVFEFLFHSEYQGATRILFAEAEMTDVAGEHWTVFRELASFDIKRNHVPATEEEFYAAVTQYTGLRKGKKPHTSIVGAWSISESLTASKKVGCDKLKQSSSADAMDLLTNSICERERNVLAELQEVLGPRFVLNKANMVELYYHTEQYIDDVQRNSDIIESLAKKIKEVEKYGVSRFEKLKSECELIERMQSCLAGMDVQDAHVSKIYQSLEKLLFLWSKLSSQKVPLHVKSKAVLVSRIRKIVDENKDKIAVLQRVKDYSLNFKYLVDERNRLVSLNKALQNSMKRYCLLKKIDLNFVYEQRWHDFFILMDRWLVLDNLSESTHSEDSSQQQQDLFISRQLDRPLAIYHIPGVNGGDVDVDHVVTKLKQANQSIFRVFLTQNPQHYDSLVRAGLGWAQISR